MTPIVEDDIIDRLPDCAAPLVDIVERIMTQHWDLASCWCWVCQSGRAVGCRPREQFLRDQYPHVDVEMVNAL